MGPDNHSLVTFLRACLNSPTQSSNSDKRKRTRVQVPDMTGMNCRRSITFAPLSLHRLTDNNLPLLPHHHHPKLRCLVLSSHHALVVPTAPSSRSWALIVGELVTFGSPARKRDKLTGQVDRAAPPNHTQRHTNTSCVPARR
jgi:hypothetical protein